MGGEVQQSLQSGCTGRRPHVYNLSQGGEANDCSARRFKISEGDFFESKKEGGHAGQGSGTSRVALQASLPRSPADPAGNG
jgi:hypothetical protein